MKTIIKLENPKHAYQPHVSIERAHDSDGVFMRVPRRGFVILTREQAENMAASLRYLTRSEEGEGNIEQD